MAQPSSILNADRGRASATAWGILCILILLQSVLVVRFLLVRPKAAPPAPAAAVSTAAASKPAEPTLPPQVLPSAPPLPPLSAPVVSISPPPVGSLVPSAPPPTGTSQMAPPAVGTFGSPVPAAPVTALPQVVGPASVTTAPPAPVFSPAKPASGLPADPGSGLKRLPLGSGNMGSGLPPAGTPAGAADMSLNEMVDMAKQVRSLGDMQGALETLNKTDLRFPNQPSVLAEMAQCYEQMGLGDKAMALWKRLEAMSPGQAEGYHDLASRRLSAGPVMPGGKSGAVLGGMAEGSKVLSLGACQATRDPAIVNGEKVVLRIPVLRQGSGAVDPGQVDIDVYFFDRVNGEKVAQTIADDPVSTWAAAPVDWSGIGEEPLNVTYYLPPLTPGEVQAHGRRSYHGYLVKLYYQHKLQDTAAEPRDLLDYGSNVPQAGAGSGNPLLPPVTN